MKALISAAEIYRARLALADRFAGNQPERVAAGTGTAALASTASPSVPPLPDYVLQSLARMRLLIDVPFHYLVPDAGLLPPESARFFHLDPAWLDQLSAGALAVGAGGTREQAQAELATALAPDQLGKHLPLVRDLERGRGVLELALQQASHTVDPELDVTGVLIRSALVSGWPQLQLRAYSTTAIPSDANPAMLDPALSVPVLRMQRLDPSVLLVLFAGVPKLVWLEEPHHAIQLGVEPVSGGFQVRVRGADGKEGAVVPVPMRDPGRGVVDVLQLGQRLDAAARLAAPRKSAALALALTRAPARQRFSAPGGTV